MLIEQLKSVSWVAYTKFSGLARDVLIVFLFGLSEVSDALFFSMTFIMFFQLVIYVGNVNVLGKYQKFQSVIRVLNNYRKSVIAIILLTIAALFQVVAELEQYDVSLFNLYLICFSIMVPLALIVGLFASYGVIGGDSKAHVRITSIQNTSVILSMLVIDSFYADRYLFFAWAISFLVVYIFVAYGRGNESESESESESDEMIGNTIMYAFLSPVLMFSIVMLERFFYSNVEGSLGLIKLLETAAMSVSFLLEVLFMNKFIAQLGAANYKPEKIMSLLKSQFLKAAFLGIILMSIITLSIIGLFEYGAFPFKISAELNEYFLALSFLYLVYFLVVICRDYIERFYFSINKPKPVVSANFVLLMLTLLFNWLFLAYAPISIAVISILLMGFKVAYLVLGAKTYVNNSEVRGDYV